MDLLNSLGQWVQPYMGDIAIAIVATLLVIYGDSINRTVKRGVGKKSLPVRFGAFIALCTVGYGFLTVNVTHWVSQGLSKIPTPYLPVAVLLSFVILAFLAERKNQM